MGDDLDYINAFVEKMRQPLLKVADCHYVTLTFRSKKRPPNEFYAYMFKCLEKALNEWKDTYGPGIEHYFPEIDEIEITQFSGN